MESYKKKPMTVSERSMHPSLAEYQEDVDAAAAEQAEIDALTASAELIKVGEDVATENTVFKNKGGRPSKKSIGESPRNREKVIWMVASGVAEKIIARELHITIPTLRLHFEDILLDGRAILRARLMEVASKRALAGHLPAVEFMLKHMNNAEAKEAAAEFNRTDEAEEEIIQARRGRQPKLGKKEQAVIDAKTAGVGTEWGDDLVRRTRAN